MSPRRLLAAASGLACGLAVAGCGSSPPTRFYTLDPAPPATTPAPVLAAIPPVRVDAVHLPPVFDRVELVRETGAHTVTVDDFARWSAPVGETARRTLTQDLAARLPAGAVTFPDAPKPPDGRGLVVDVLALGQSGGQATMDVSWTLTAGGRTGRAPPVAYTGRTLRLTAPSAGPGPDAVPADLSALLGALADSIAADLVHAG